MKNIVTKIRQWTQGQGAITHYYGAGHQYLGNDRDDERFVKEAERHERSISGRAVSIPAQPTSDVSLAESNTPRGETWFKEGQAAANDRILRILADGRLNGEWLLLSAKLAASSPEMSIDKVVGVIKSIAAQNRAPAVNFNPVTPVVRFITPDETA